MNSRRYFCSSCDTRAASELRAEEELRTHLVLGSERALDECVDECRCDPGDLETRQGPCVGEVLVRALEVFPAFITWFEHWQVHSVGFRQERSERTRRTRLVPHLENGSEARMGHRA